MWEAIQRVAMGQAGLVALFITDADQTICRSQERYSAFRSTFLGPDRSAAVPARLAGAAPAISVQSAIECTALCCVTVQQHRPTQGDTKVDFDDAGNAGGTAPVTDSQAARARPPTPAKIVILGGTSLGDLNLPPPPSRCCAAPAAS